MRLEVGEHERSRGDETLMPVSSCPGGVCINAYLGSRVSFARGPVLRIANEGRRQGHNIYLQNQIWPGQSKFTGTLSHVEACRIAVWIFGNTAKRVLGLRGSQIA